MVDQILLGRLKINLTNQMVIQVGKGQKDAY